MGVCYNIINKKRNILLIDKREKRFYFMQDLKQVKNKIRLVDYIQSTGVKVKALGGGTFGVEPCPICRTQRPF